MSFTICTLGTLHIFSTLSYLALFYKAYFQRLGIKHGFLLWRTPLKHALERPTIQPSNSRKIILLCALMNLWIILTLCFAFKVYQLFLLNISLSLFSNHFCLSWFILFLHLTFIYICHYSFNFCVNQSSLFAIQQSHSPFTNHYCLYIFILLLYSTIFTFVLCSFNFYMYQLILCMFAFVHIIFT